jgi:hypothetical protein
MAYAQFFLITSDAFPNLCSHCFSCLLKLGTSQVIFVRIKKKIELLSRNRSLDYKLFIRGHKRDLQITRESLLCIKYYPVT